MKEASPVKYYFAKYFFLALGLLQWIVASLIFFRSGSSPKSQFAVFVFFTLGLILISVFLMLASKIKRVALSKKKVAIIGPYETHRYEWPDVKSVKFIPLFNVYRMKIKGKKGKIYFLPSEDAEAIYGLFPSISGIEGKKEK
jgi:hypothetical protein